MNTSPHTQAIDTINELNAYRLARIAYLASPAALDSPGAQLLASVRDSLVEWVEHTRDDYSVETIVDRASTEACAESKSAVPVYTHEIWRTYLDLRAYRDESADDFDGGTPSELATFTLGSIAERLFVALAEEYVETYVSAQDEALGSCDADENGECSGACVTRPHVWSPSGARCTRTNCTVVGSGDPCGDGNCEGDD